MSKTEDWKTETALKRYQLIAPLMDDTLDAAKKQGLRKKLAGQNGISERSIYRYESAYSEGGFANLRPKNRDSRPYKGHPESFGKLIAEAVILKREVPTRSTSQIITILELEGKVNHGILARSTVARHLNNLGYGNKQMRMYTEAGKSSSKRFWKQHRMQLLEGDIKYGPKLPVGKNGKFVQTYLCALIDNHSRYIVSSRFYDNQEAAIVEDNLRRAVLTYGKCDAVYVDRGTQYVSRELKSACARLGIRLLHAKPYSPQSKGAIEVFNRLVNSFIAETKAAKIKTLEAMNDHWNNFIDGYYHEKKHEGLEELLGEDVRPEDCKPVMQWNRDSRPLQFIDTGIVAQAFLHHEIRRVDKSGCISFQGRRYEVSVALIGTKVEIAFDPMATEILTVRYKDMKPFDVKPLVIGEFCTGSKPKLPVHMLPVEPDSSRFLDAIAKSAGEKKAVRAQTIGVTSFRSMQGGGGHV
ncbi:MAG: DDE-type integrase/transposase/recombinase [Saccharofermentanales bacterium]